MVGRVLLVEGELDAQVLGFVALRTGVSVERGGPKSSLAPKARERRAKGKPGSEVVAWYLRDRDFDFDAPDDRGRLSVDKSEDGDVLGWRWCRHSIESYLLDPRVVEAAIGWSSADYGAALREAGRRIAGYTSVRWALGRTRGEISQVRLPTTNPWPQGQGREFWLPGDLSFEINLSEGFSRVHEWRGCVAAPDKSRFEEIAGYYHGSLATMSDAEDVLAWHSGKDLLVALTPKRLRGKMIQAGELRVRLRDWVRENADEAVELFPEWADLCRRINPPE